MIKDRTAVYGSSLQIILREIKKEYDAIFSGRKPMQIIKRAVEHSSQKCAIAIGISGDVILDLMAESINSPIEYGGVLF